MALLLHDTFSGSGALAGSVPDIVGNAWTLQEVWPNSNSASADTNMKNSSGRCKMAKNGSGQIYPTLSYAVEAQYGSYCKAGCTVPNNFDLEFQVGTVPDLGDTRLWILFRANFSAAPSTTKEKTWTGIQIRPTSQAVSPRFEDGNNQDAFSAWTSSGGATNNMIVILQVRGNQVTPIINGATQTTRTFSAMQSSGNVYVGYGTLYAGPSLTPFSNSYNASGTLNYIKIADPGDLNAPVGGGKSKNLVIGGGMI